MDRGDGDELRFVRYLAFLVVLLMELRESFPVRAEGGEIVRDGVELRRDVVQVVIVPQDVLAVRRVRHDAPYDETHHVLERHLRNVLTDGENLPAEVRFEELALLPPAVLGDVDLRILRDLGDAVRVLGVEDAQDVVEEPHMLLEIPPPSEDLVGNPHVLEHPYEGFHVMQVVAKQRNMLQITFLFPIFENATIET